MRIGQLYGAEVFVNVIVKTRNGWSREMKISMTEIEDLVKAVRPYREYKVLLPERLHGAQWLKEKAKSKPELVETEILTTYVKKIEINITYEEH